MAVIGGGVVGVLAGIRLLEKGIDCAIFERQADFGGIWTTHGNNHSTLQVQGSCLATRCAQQRLCAGPPNTLAPLPARLTPSAVSCRRQRSRTARTRATRSASAARWSRSAATWC